MLENYIVFRFKVRPLHSKEELRELLETLERRGGIPIHCGDGVHELQVPTSITWLPFYRTLKDANSVSGVTLISSGAERGGAPVILLKSSE